MSALPFALRLLLVTPSYPPMIGGGEYYVQSLARELAQRGHRVVVVTSAIARQQDFWGGCAMASGQAVAIEAGVTVVRLPVSATPLRRAGQLFLRRAMVLSAMLLGRGVSRLLARASRAFPPIIGLDAALAGQSRPDLVHTFNVSWEHGLMAGHALARSLNAPHIATPFLHVGAPGQRRVWRNSAMPHQRGVLCQAQAILAMSEAEREGLLKMGAAAGAVHVVGAAATPPEMPATASSDLTQESAAAGRPLVLFLGRVDRDKGALTAMRAVAELDRHGVPCQLILAGQPDRQVARLANRWRASGAPIRLLGAVDDGVKHWLLKQCRVLVLPSRVESFGLVLLEAWQQGKPVIAADVGGPQSLIRPEVDGLLTPWGDAGALAAALQRLLADPELAHRMGAAGRTKAAQQFTWPQVADRVEAVYRAVLASARETR